MMAVFQANMLLIALAVVVWIIVEWKYRRKKK